MIVLDTDWIGSDETKERTITIDATKVYHDVDMHTAKFVDGKEMPVRQENAISSDHREHLDGDVIIRLVDYRDAKLRLILNSVLDGSEEFLTADNTATMTAQYVYKLSLSLSFKDVLLRPLAMLIHKYLVWGALFDWYTQLGIDGEARAYGSQLMDIEEEITSKVHPEGYEKRPLQPFGPAYKI